MHNFTEGISINSLQDAEEIAQDLEKFQEQYEQIDIQLKDFLKITIPLAVAIIGFSIPVLDNTAIVHQRILFFIALLCILLSFLAGIIYLYALIWLKKDIYKTTANFYTTMNRKTSEFKKDIVLMKAGNAEVNKQRQEAHQDLEDDIMNYLQYISNTSKQSIKRDLARHSNI